MIESFGAFLPGSNLCASGERLRGEAGRFYVVTDRLPVFDGERQRCAGAARMRRVSLVRLRGAERQTPISSSRLLCSHHGRETGTFHHALSPPRKRVLRIQGAGSFQSLLRVSAARGVSGIYPCPSVAHSLNNLRPVFRPHYEATLSALFLRREPAPFDRLALCLLVPARSGGPKP